MSRTTYAAVLLALVAPAAGRAEERGAEVRELVRQLGDREYAARERATRRLRGYGPAALPALRLAAANADPETRRRAAALVEALEVDELLRPKRVTLPGGKQKLSQVLRDIGRQTGYKLEADGDGTVFLGPVVAAPFWEAVEHVRRTGRESWRVCSWAETLRFEPAESRSPFVCVSGAFRVEALRLHENRDVDLARTGRDGARPRDRRLRLFLEVMAEPKHLLLGVEPARLDLAVCDEGSSLANAGPEDEEQLGAAMKAFAESLQPNWFRMGTRFHCGTQLALRRGSPRAETVRVLKGTLVVKVVADRRPVVVSTDIRKAQGAEFRLRDGTIKLLSVEDQKDSIELSFSVPASGDRQAHAWHERIRLEDGRGNRLEASSTGTTSDARGVYEISVGFRVGDRRKDGPPRLVIEDWRVASYPVTFTFHDLPLP